MSTKTSKKWTMAKVNALTWEEAFELWKTLPAPDMEEMNGEYRGQLHDGDDIIVRQMKDKVFSDESSELGYWLGKAYKPLTGSKGHAYNIYLKRGRKPERLFRSATELGPSPVDGRPSFIMYYRAFNNFGGDIDLVDEVRRLDQGLYLGVGTANQPLIDGFSKMDGERSKAEFFMLLGPIGEWVEVDEGLEDK